MAMNIKPPEKKTERATSDLEIPKNPLSIIDSYVVEDTARINKVIKKYRNEQGKDALTQKVSKTAMQRIHMKAKDVKPKEEVKVGKVTFQQTERSDPSGSDEAYDSLPEEVVGHQKEENED